MALSDLGMMFRQQQPDDDEDPSGGAGIPSAPPSAPPGPPAPSDSDDGDSGQSAPSGAPQDKFDALRSMLLSPQELDQARQDKLQNARLAAMADNLSNRQSFGNFFLKQMNPHVDGSAGFAAANQAIDQGIANKKTLAAQTLEKPQLQYAQSIMDPRNPTSVMTKQLTASLIGGMPNAKDYAPVLQMINDPSVSGAEVMTAIDKNPVLKDAMSQSIAGQKLLATMNMFKSRMDLSQERLNTQKDSQAAQAADSFNKDTILSQLQKQQQNIRRGAHTLDTVKTLTPQLLSEIQLDIANAISGGRAAAVTTQDKTEFDSLDQKMASIKQHLLSTPEDVNNPQIRGYISDVLNRLDSAYSANMAERARGVAVGKSYLHNPAAQQAIQDKVQQYTGQNSSPFGADANASEGQSKAMAALAEANKVLNDPNAPKEVKAKALAVQLKFAKERGMVK